MFHFRLHFFAVESLLAPNRIGTCFCQRLGRGSSWHGHGRMRSLLVKHQTNVDSCICISKPGSELIIFFLRLVRKFFSDEYSVVGHTLHSTHTCSCLFEIETGERNALRLLQFAGCKICSTLFIYSFAFFNNIIKSVALSFQHQFEALFQSKPSNLRQQLSLPNFSTPKRCIRRYSVRPFRPLSTPAPPSGPMPRNAAPRPSACRVHF